MDLSFIEDDRDEPTSFIHYFYKGDIHVHLERKIWEDYTQKWNLMKMEELLP